MDVGTDITATFSEDVRPSTVTQSTFKLRDAAENVVPASVSYDAASRTATLNPDNALKKSETYVATLAGGEEGVKDPAGNPLAADVIWPFTTVLADTQAPTVTIDVRPPAVTNNPSPTFRFSADDPDATFECSLSRERLKRSFVRCTSPMEYERMDDGMYYFRVRVRDAAGNRSKATAYRFRVDTTTPAPSRPDLVAGSDTGSSDSDNVTRDPTPTFTGSAEAGSTVRVDEGQNLLRQVTTNNAGTWKFTVAGDQQLADGTHSITARATDRAGNASPASEALSVTIDTTKPTIVPRSPRPASRITARAPTVRASVSDETNTLAKSNIRLFVDGDQKANFTYNTGDRVISYRSTTLAFGTHAVRVEATDKAGMRRVRQWNFQVVR